VLRCGVGYCIAEFQLAASIPGPTSWITGLAAVVLCMSYELRVMGGVNYSLTIAALSMLVDMDFWLGDDML
jgi:hypothetical protein